MAQRQGNGTYAALAVGVVGIAMVVVGVESMNRTTTSRRSREVPGGDVERGREALHRYNCGSCHKIPGVDGANGTRGQPLAGLSLRSDIVGALANTPEDVVSWIRNPKAYYPQTAMPNLDVSQQDAVDMVAYLYSLPP